VKNTGGNGPKVHVVAKDSRARFVVRAGACEDPPHRSRTLPWSSQGDTIRIGRIEDRGIDTEHLDDYDVPFRRKPNFTSNTGFRATRRCAVFSFPSNARQDREIITVRKFRRESFHVELRLGKT